jgi:hypothetical protein
MGPRPSPQFTIQKGVSESLPRSSLSKEEYEQETRGKGPDGGKEQR